MAILPAFNHCFLPPSPLYLEHRTRALPHQDSGMDFTVENICGFLIRSKLLPPEEVRALQQRWLADAKDQAGSLTQFIKWLVANKYVSEYQAVLLAKGHADNFFLNQYKIVDRLG